MDKNKDLWSFFKKTVITRMGDTSDKPEPYLNRWNILKCPWFSVKIHKILRDDDDCLHDHPWSFFSIILKGGYYETTKKRLSSKSKVHKIDFSGLLYKTWHGPGSILWRPNPFPHRLELKKIMLGEDPVYKHCTTLVVTFKRERVWGFYTPTGWIEWFKYSSKNKCE